MIEIVNKCNRNLDGGRIHWKQRGSMRERLMGWRVVLENPNPSIKTEGAKATQGAGMMCRKA